MLLRNVNVSSAAVHFAMPDSQEAKSVVEIQRTVVRDGGSNSFGYVLLSFCHLGA